MKLFSICLVVLGIQGYLVSPCYSQSNKILLDLIQKGELTKAESLAKTLEEKTEMNSASWRQFDSLRQIAGRIKLDFNMPEKKADSLLRKSFGVFTPMQKSNWENKGWLEYRIIDGEKRYFNRSISNLRLRFNQIRDSIYPDSAKSDEFTKFKINHIQNVLKQVKSQGDLAVPVNLTLTYRIKVQADAVPPGETIRCWMPWPKENIARQQNIHLISSSPLKISVAPDNCDQRSLYMEQVAKTGQPAVFEIKFSYTPSAQYFDLDKINILPYNTSSNLYKRFTEEKPPQIRFTNEIKALANRITGSASKPQEIVRSIYHWIDANIIWSGALEYSIIPDIPHYVLQNRKGDCGMQTLLFMTLARYKGIPVRWQSGWMMHPHEVNLHDWCEVYYEGTGWVPLDMSFGLQKSKAKAVEEFYISGIDSYRLIVNTDISSEFNPAKQFLRSEPFDFQRGEVEWKGGNLYFDKWSYNMKVEYK